MEEKFLTVDDFYGLEIIEEALLPIKDFIILQIEKDGKIIYKAKMTRDMYECIDFKFNREMKFWVDGFNVCFDKKEIYELVEYNLITKENAEKLMEEQIKNLDNYVSHLISDDIPKIEGVCKVWGFKTPCVESTEDPTKQ